MLTPQEVSSHAFPKAVMGGYNMSAVDEFLDDPRSFALVEWPERINGIIPDDAVRITLRHLSDTAREIRVSK